MTFLQGLPEKHCMGENARTANPLFIRQTVQVLPIGPLTNLASFILVLQYHDVMCDQLFYVEAYCPMYWYSGSCIEPSIPEEMEARGNSIKLDSPLIVE